MEAGSNLNPPTAGSLPDAADHLRLTDAILLHAQVWATQRRLDRALAVGGSATGSPQLALRAEQLTNRRMRDRWSGALRDVVEEFDNRSPPRLRSTIPGRREVLGIWRETLLGLAAQLQDIDRVRACGVARLRIVMTDGSGPLLDPHSAESMGELLWWIEEGMEQEI